MWYMIVSVPNHFLSFLPTIMQDKSGEVSQRGE